MTKNTDKREAEIHKNTKPLSDATAEKSIRKTSEKFLRNMTDQSSKKQILESPKEEKCGSILQAEPGSAFFREKRLKKRRKMRFAILIVHEGSIDSCISYHLIHVNPTRKGTPGNP